MGRIGEMKPIDMRKILPTRHKVFLRFDMRHWAIYNQHENYKSSDRGHTHFFKLTCDIGDPPLMTPTRV